MRKKSYIISCKKIKQKLIIVINGYKTIFFFLSKIRQMLIAIFIIFILYKTQTFNSLGIYKRYINACKKSIKLYNNKEKSNLFPFFSICIPVYNMEKYIEISLLSVLNQSFRNFEIVIINDYSLDNSVNIIKKLQFENTQIRLINHENNFGVYISRIDAIKNSKGNYIIFLDPDDLFSNRNLLSELYEYNLINNEDIIEFSVILQEEIKNHLFYPFNHRSNHFHNFKEPIIYHPYLSNILFFENNNYSDIICRCLWNKMIRREILFKTINFLGDLTYEKEHFDFAEDTILNILNFEFAYNYSNINLIGYMYNIRKESMSHSDQDQNIRSKMGNNIFFFYKLFYKYIKTFNKDLNYLYFDLKSFDYYFKYIILNISSSSNTNPIIQFYKNLSKEENITKEFKKYVKHFIKHFQNKTS